MRFIFIIIIVAGLSTLALVRCDNDNMQQPLTSKQTALAKEIESAMPGSILVLHNDMKHKRSHQFSVLYSHEQNGDVSIAIVGNVGIWVCGSMNHSKSAKVIATELAYVIHRNDSEYDNKLRDLMFEMVKLPTESHR